MFIKNIFELHVHAAYIVFLVKGRALISVGSKFWCQGGDDFW